MKGRVCPIGVSPSNTPSTAGDRSGLLLLYLAEVEEARRHLAAQWPRYDAPVEYTEAELARLREEDWQETSLPPDWHERLAETVRESRANYTLMVHWLDRQRGVER
jgi:hypothetical protein